jgi:hypothetical protein
MLFSYMILQSTGGGGREGGVVGGGGEVYVCTKWISKATQCYVCSEGDGFQCFQTWRKWSKLTVTWQASSHIICENWKIIGKKKERAKAHTHKTYIIWHRKEKDWQIIRIIVGTVHVHVLDLHGHWLVWSDFEHTFTS